MTLVVASTPVARIPLAYRAAIGGFAAFLALTLLTLVDVRRGFLFRAYPLRTMFGVLTPIHALMLAAGLAGISVCYRRMTKLERDLPNTSSYVKVLTFGLLALRGTSTSFLLSFVVGAPMLNVTTIVLALALLPAPFAVTRIVAGVFVTIVATYVVARVADRWDRPSVVVTTPARAGWMQRIGGVFRLFDFDRLDRIVGTPSDRVDRPSQLIGAWLRASGQMAIVLVPALWVWSVVAAGIFQVLPASFGNDLPSVVLAAVGGTFFMISTWSEIPMALQLIEAGFDGPAAALLVVLPAISLPCMMMLGSALQRFRMIALLSAAVMVVGIGAGLMFL